MRTTLNIDDDLYRAVKIKAVTELVDAALRRLLEQTSPMNTDAAPPRSAPPYFLCVRKE